MAGSYDHCRNDEDGKFTFDLIENMGDAHEACHMMFWMLWWLTQGHAEWITQAQNAYYAAATKDDFGVVGDM